MIEIVKLRSKLFIVVMWYRFLNLFVELFFVFDDFVGKFDVDGKEYGWF